MTYGFSPASPPDEGERSILDAIVDQAAIAITSARLASGVVQAEEATRRAIERDIHDGVQQSIVAHLARLELLKRRMEAGQAGPSDITELQQDVGTILDELRDLARGIHPPVLADMGLTDAVAERAARMPIPVRLGPAMSPRTGRFPAEIESTAYFVVCEAFANILKHAQARSVDVDIRSDVSFLRVAIDDDGRGFDPAATSLRGPEGLVDRVAALGGEQSSVEKHISTVFGKLGLDPSEEAINRRAMAVLTLLRGEPHTVNEDGAASGTSA